MNRYGVKSLRLVILFLCIMPVITQSNTADHRQLDKQRFAQQRFLDWKQLMTEQQGATTEQKLQQVNAFFNQHVLYLNDIKLWLMKDYWATPKETLRQGAGDCEDYAIAKYMTLKKLGVDNNRLRLTYVKAIRINEAHMVLAYFENRRSVPLILDNLIIDIKPASQRSDLLPVYSFNSEGIWLSSSKGAQKKVKNAGGLSLWQDLLSRINNGQ